MNIVCIECGRIYPIETGRYLCDDCAAHQTADQPLRGQLEVRLSGQTPADWAALGLGGTSAAAQVTGAPASKKAAVDLGTASSAAAGPAGAPEEGRFFSGERSSRSPFADSRSLMPVPAEFFPSIPVGETPLWSPKRLRSELDRPGIFLKDDTANPTGSLKDRASYLVAAFAASRGLPDIVVASTGNAGSSMAGVAAAAGLNVRLYLPASAPQAKIVQAMQYGANVIKVEGTYDDAFDASLAYVTAHGGLSRNTAHNPLTVEGKKSVSLEIFRQLGAVVPDVVYVPTGDGVILSGVYKGFEDLMTLGLTDRMPEVVCVQAVGSAALARALARTAASTRTSAGTLKSGASIGAVVSAHSGKLPPFTHGTNISAPPASAADDFANLEGAFGTPLSAKTVADSISVDVPRGGYYALQRLIRHNGRCLLVSDEAIVSAQRRLSSSSGLFAEPAASAAFAGLLADLEAGRGPGRSDRAVVLLTGNGLKDIATAMKGVES